MKHKTHVEKKVIIGNTIMNNTSIATCGVICDICLCFQRDKNKCFECNNIGNKPYHCIVCSIKSCTEKKGNKLTPVVFVFLVFMLQIVYAQPQRIIDSSEKISWQRKFDDLDRLTKLIDPAGRETTFAYSNETSGKSVVTKTDAEGNTVQQEYDEHELLKTMKDGSGLVSYQYDNFGRVIQVQRQGEAATQYQYDVEDRITSLMVGDYYKITYTYDFLGRLSTMITPAGTITYVYNTGQGQVKRELPNGATTTWEFGANGQQLRTTHTDANMYILAEYRYQYRPDGLIDLITEKTRNGEIATKYEYDNVGRLIHVMDQAGSDYKYEYDELGNRLQASQDGTIQLSKYDWAGRLTKFNGKTCSHDPAGNLNSIVLDGYSMNYQFNSDCQLAKVNEQVFYKYDGNGKLIERLADGITTKFITDPFSEYWQPLVMDNHMNEKTFLIWDKNTPLIMIKNGKPEYILTDHLGSARIIVDEQGKTKQFIDYKPFGEFKNDANISGLTIGFTGLFYDSNAKLYLTKARAYNASLGQFLQIEPQQKVPSGSQQELALYSYCGNDPANFNDLDGAWPQSVWGLKNWASQFHLWEMQQQANLSTQVLANWYRQNSSIIGSWGLELAIQYNTQIHNIAFSSFSSTSLAYANVNRRAWTALKHWSLSPNTSVNQALLGSSPAATYSAITGVASAFLGGLDAGHKWLSTTTRAIQSSNMPIYISDRHSWGWSGTGVNQIAPSVKYAYREKHRASINPLRSSGQISRHHVGTLVSPWGTTTREITRSVNANPIEEFIYNYAPLQNYADFNDPSYRFESKTTTHESYRVVTKGGVTQYYPGNQTTAPDRMNRVLSPPLMPNPISPSPVGGVSLAGAGDALYGIGQIEGLTLDANKNLVLISKKDKQTNLPPMRLDDVVTVFRTVYINGDGPTVTIDPNPQDPEHSAMIIKHDKGTENSYVGWILYQADRLMKTYMLGVDNISTKNLVSLIPGYQDVLNAVYFGDGISNSSKYEGKWERFWIVPAKVNEFTNKNKDLSVFDVTLKLKTQVMKWENGALVDDNEGVSSTGAIKFKEWFTANYDALAKEQYLTPPSGFGINDSVPVFAELQRIAVITALAEKMRDQGIPMPFWMRDYEVKPVQFEKYTPALLVTRNNGTTQARIFGGVALTAGKENVKQFTTIGDINELPKEDQIKAETKLNLANSLAAVIQEYKPIISGIGNKTFEIANETYQTISFPGSETKALSPCRLNESDLVIPTIGGNEINLSRYFNSFFNPNDIWGQGWTMDLPRLEEVKVPVEKSSREGTYQTAYELITPLNTVYARFFAIKEVPMLASQLQVPDAECNFFGLVNAKPAFWSAPTLKLIGKDGESWHFSENGYFVASEKDGFLKVYVRNEKGTVKQIIGILGKTKVATIDLNYNNDNILISATGTNESEENQTITYEYDQSGKLSGIISAQGKLGYNYKNNWVSEVNWKDSSATVINKKQEEIILSRFEYNSNGQLTAEYAGNGEKVDYTVSSDKKHITLKMNQAEGSIGTSSVIYDESFRPVETNYTDGSQVKWTYPENGGSSAEYTDMDGKKTIITESSDKTKRTIESSEQPPVSGIYDPAGRLTHIEVDGQNLFKQQWSPYGELETYETKNSVLRPQYDEDGLTKNIMLYPPGSGKQLKVWVSVELDIAGRPSKITDYSGLQKAINYDSKGEISQFITVRDGKNYGYSFNRNGNGKLENVQSSWGKEQFAYDSNGTLSKLVINKPGNQKEEEAIVEFDNGRLNKIRQFDGGQIEISYKKEGLFEDLPSQIVCPNGLKLSYNYDETGNLTDVSIGETRQIKLEYDNKGRMVGYAFCKK